MAAISGRNAFVYYTSDGGSTYNLIARVKDITIPQNTDEEESTSHDSAGVREYIPGHSDNTCTLTMVFDDTDSTHQFLQTAADAKTQFGFRFRPRVASGAAQRTWSSGFITSLEKSAPLEGVQEMTVTIRLSGTPTNATQ